jgi:hypothetical protein
MPRPWSKRLAQALLAIFLALQLATPADAGRKGFGYGKRINPSTVTAPPVVPSGITYDTAIGNGVDANGFADLPLRVGANRYFVNSSTGNDANTCTQAKTAATPKATLASVEGCVTDLNGDQVLIAEGTSYAKNFTANFDTLNGKRGFSPVYPTVFQSYDPADALNETKYGRASGSNRPQIGTDGSNFNVNGGGADPDKPMSKIAFRGLNFPLGLISVTATPLKHDYVLFENNIIAAPGGFAFQMRSATDGRATNLILRNNAVYGQYGGARTGAYIDWTTNVTLEDNVFWHNGWLPGASRDDPVGSGGLQGDEVFRHVWYIQEDGFNVTIRRNLVADGPADGGQNRSSTLAYGNFYIDNPISLIGGGGTVYSGSTPTGVDLDLAMNVILGDADIRTGFPRGVAITTQNGRPTSKARYNVVARSRNPSGVGVITLSTDNIYNVPSYMTYDHNVADLWAGSSNTTSDTGGTFPAQNHATYTNNIWDKATSGSNTNVGSVSLPNAYTAAALYSALGYADKAAFIAYAIAHPEAHIQRNAMALMRTGYGITGPPLSDLTTTIDLVKSQFNGSIFVNTLDGSTLSIVSGAPAGFTVNSTTKSWQYDGSDNGTSSGNVVIRETLGGSTHDSTIAWNSYVAPTLSSISVTGIGSTTATINFTTDSGGAGQTVYWVAAARNVNYELHPGLIKQGGDSDYDAATVNGGKAGSQAVAASGAQSISLTALTPSTGYWLYLMQEKSASPHIWSKSYGNFAAFPFTTLSGGGGFVWNDSAGTPPSNANWAISGSGTIGTYSTGSGDALLRASSPLTASHSYDITWTSGASMGPGVCTSSFGTTNWVGNATGSSAYGSDGSIYYNAGVVTTGATYAVGDIIRVSYDGTNIQYYKKVAGSFVAQGSAVNVSGTISAPYPCNNGSNGTVVTADWTNAG